ncbi:ABC transporter permease [Falsirhodobacter sp. 1013]|uniref:ABC transporter permease n=1 Tax=Falsirhodobacter sp. 1013 TaxID=3417566 RepID=UPI003EBC0361
MSRTTPHAPPTVWSVTRWTAIGFTVLVLAYLVIPTVVIIPLSFSSESFLSFPPKGFSWRWYETFFSTIDYHYAIGNSLKIGIPSAALASLCGTLAALAMARANLPWPKVLAMMMIAPIILPQIVLALGLYPLMVKVGLQGTLLGIVLAHAVVAMPLVFISVSASLRGCPEQLEQAAATLGANGWNTFWHVTFPLIHPGILVGFIFAFTFSFDELILSMFLTSSTTRTMPRLLWEQLNFQMTPVITAASVTLLVCTVVLIGIAGWINQRNARLVGERKHV